MIAWLADKMYRFFYKYNLTHNKYPQGVHVTKTIQKEHNHRNVKLIDWFIMFNATFSNISAISWQTVLVVEEAGVPAENHRPWASNW
jgi:hypothetical protein